MYKAKFKVIAFILVLIFTLVAVWGCTTTPEPTPTPKIPESLSIAAYEVGGGTYLQVAALGEGILKKFGTRVRNVPVGTATARLNMVRTGQTDFGATVDHLNCQEGIYDFSNLEWGPQPIRILYQVARQSAFTFVTRGDSGIVTGADIKGKKVAWPTASPFTQKATEAFLAFFNLTKDDVELVEMRSIISMFQSVIDGTTDGTIMDNSGSKAYELEASPAGIHYIEVPAADKEGWARMKAIQPIYSPINCKFGAGLSETNMKELATVPHPTYYVMEDTDEELAYSIVKMMVESFDEYKDITMAMQWYVLEDCVATDLPNPYHSGAIKYFKEKGVWTEQLQKNQDELVARQKALRAYWNQVLDEAIAAGKKGKEIPAIWLEKRAERFPAFWMETPVS
ncbi:TAXI family TRAP transporter solute-binding subunit [Chloroflexota bacterium]